ncbi:MATE family efflux transporter [Streptomyces sp. LaPpAH-108]|uniref:MATE family efflux transporter n=1 Tax=Streptomyces sp. LaPpAH-108 TaxID=1155714 RepID=UPI0003700962|nr:MATE family efflux transporter [Streptomyces sp. LaPpAH-108]
MRFGGSGPVVARGGDGDTAVESGGTSVLGPAEARRALLGLGLPVYCELLSGVVVGVVDTLWVARLGRAAVGAVAAAGTLENLLLGVVLMAGTGVTMVLADALGARRLAEIPPAIKAVGVLWLVITGVVAGGGFVFRHEVARLLVGGGTGEVHRLVAEFLAVSFPGLTVFFAQNVVDGIFKGLGDTRTPMRAALVANGCVLLLDPLLIYGVGVLPALGVRGAALGTVLGRAVALGVSLVLLWRRRGVLLGPSGAGAGSDLFAALRRVLGVGLPASADFVLRMGIGAALLGMVARFGEDPLAAYGIGTKVILFVTMAFYALRQAGGILTARTRGAGQRAERVIGVQSGLLAVLVGAGAGLVLAGCGRVVMGCFTSADGVIDSGSVLLWFLLPYLVALGGVVGPGGVFMGGGRARGPLGVTALGACVQLPLAHWLSSVGGLGVQGVWLSMSLGTGVQWGLTAVMFRRLVRSGGGPDGGDRV